MDMVTLSPHNRILKAENLFLDLSKEINTAVSFLHLLKDHSEKMVKKLVDVTSPQIFLKEYIQVNSYFFKYLSFLTEINCKFEMFQILEASLWNDVANLKVDQKFDFDFSNSSRGFMNFDQNELLEVMKKAITDISENEVVFGNKESSVSQEIKETACVEKIKASEHLKNLVLDKSNANFQLTLARNDMENDYEKEFVTPNGHYDNIEDLNVNPTSNNSFLESQSSPKQLVPQNTQTYAELPQEKKPEGFSVANNKNGDENNTKHNYNCNEDDDNNKKEESHNIIIAEPIPCKKISPTISPASQEAEKLFPNESIKNQNQSDISSSSEENENVIRPLFISAEVGDEIEVLVQHIKSPSEFYVHVKNKELNILGDLERKLKLIPVENKKLNVKKGQKKILMMKEIGTYALHYSICDEIWCRVKVLDWCLKFKDDLVLIILLDYGESKCVSVDTLKPIPEVFKTYPAFAIRCHLHGIFPVDMNRDCKKFEWGKETNEKMRCYLDNSDKVIIKIEPSDCYHPSNSLPVTLMFEEDGVKSINKLLVECKYAVKINEKNVEKIVKDHVDEKEYNKTLEEWNPMKEDFDSYQNSYDLNINDPAAHIYGYVGKDYDRICKQFRKTGKCFKGGSCRMEHEVLDPSGYTKDQEEVYHKAFNVLQGPAINEKLNVLVTCLSGLNHFYCIYENPNTNPDEEDLYSLVSFMNSHENIRDMRNLVIPPSIGQIVIAQYSEDAFWYRAKILDCQPEKDHYTVMFVDYGNKEDLPLARIRAIEAKYLHLPFQAMHCFIFGIKANPDVSPNEAIEFLNQRLSKNHTNIEVIAKYPGEEVTLSVNVYDKNWYNIGEEMITNGFALFKEELIVNPQLNVIPG